MLNVNGLIRSLYKDILFTIICVLVSIPLWLAFDLTDASATAEYYDNYNYIGYIFLNNDVDICLKPVSDEYALKNIETQDIMVYNNSNTKDDYKLLLKISKDTTMSLNNLKININNTVKYLKDYDNYEDINNYYYILDNRELIADSQKYVISFWNDENAILKENDSINYEYTLA